MLDGFMTHTDFPSFPQLIPEPISFYSELGESFSTTSSLSFGGFFFGSVPYLEEKYECIPSHRALFFPLLRQLKTLQELHTQPAVGQLEATLQHWWDN